MRLLPVAPDGWRYCLSVQGNWWALPPAPAAYAVGWQPHELLVWRNLQAANHRQRVRAAAAPRPAKGGTPWAV